MSSEALRAALADLGWSVFTELGVPGVVRNHRAVALDPEPVVVAAPSLFESDPRLRDQVYGWCATHAARLSASRLAGLSRALPEAARDRFQAFAATLRTHAGVRWPDGGATGWARAPEVKTRRLPVDRSALLRFRARALCGVGARADVLTALLAAPEAWTRASGLADLGYSKRAVAAILAELADAGLVTSVAAGNARTFRLADPDLLRDLLGARGLVFTPWRPVMAVAVELVALAEHAQAPPVVRRIEANNRRDALAGLAALAGLERPPITRGDPEAWATMMAWGTATARDLAGGGVPR